MVPPPGPGEGDKGNHRKTGLRYTQRPRLSEALSNPEMLMTPAMRNLVEYLELDVQRIQEKHRIDPPPVDENLIASIREAMYLPNLPPLLPKPNHSNPVFDEPCGLSLEYQCARQGKSLPPDEELFSPLQLRVNEILKSRKRASQDVIGPTEEKQSRRMKMLDDFISSKVKLKMLIVEDMELEFVRAYGKTRSAMLKEIRGVHNDLLN